MENQNLEEPPVGVKQEPPVEFVLILPRPTFGWPAIKKEKDVKPKWWVKSVEVTKFDAKWRSESKRFQTFFTCQHCQLLFKAQGRFTPHLETCSKINQARFECDICGEGFQQKNQIRHHMTKHSIEKRFHCPKCGFGFKTKDGLLKHSRSKRIYKCTVCTVKFSCKLLLDRHRSEFHGNVFKCDKYSYKTKREGNWINHKGTHNKSVVCETCQKKFATKHELKLHQMQHRHGTYATAPEETFDCDKCDKSFSTSKYLRKHQRHVHDVNEAKCEVCDKICKNRESLLIHSRTHAKVECSICHETVSKQILSYHMRLHSECLFECDLCNYSTGNKISLKEHIERMHLLRKLVEDSKCRAEFSDFKMLEKLQLRHGSSATLSEKKFKCDKCNVAFVTPKALKQHKRKIHVGKFVECQICKKKVRQYRLKSHIKFHFPGNHFECELCDFKSETKGHLKTHLKRRHRNGALICPIGCMGKFATFDQIIEHRKIHVGKKLWKCKECEYQTSSRQNLSGHIITMKHNWSRIDG